MKYKIAASYFYGQIPLYDKKKVIVCHSEKEININKTYNYIGF